MSDSLRPHRLYSPRNSPDQNTWVDSLSLLQGIFPIQESNWCLLHCRWILYQLSYQGSPTIKYHRNPSLCSITNAEEAEVEWFYEDLQDILELKPTKDALFITGDWNTKVRSQEIPGVIGKFGFGVQNEAGQRLTQFCQENALVIANTLYTWTSPDGQHQNQIDYILCSQRWRSSTQSAKTRPGADCGSDHQLLIAKFRPKLKKVGKPLDHSGMT